MIWCGAGEYYTFNFQNIQVFFFGQFLRFPCFSISVGIPFCFVHGVSMKFLSFSSSTTSRKFLGIPGVRGTSLTGLLLVKFSKVCHAKIYLLISHALSMSTWMLNNVSLISKLFLNPNCVELILISFLVYKCMYYI